MAIPHATQTSYPVATTITLTAIAEPTSKPCNQPTLNYLVINPLILQAAQQVTNKSFIQPPLAQLGHYPMLTEAEADAVMRVLAQYLPRQPQYWSLHHRSPQSLAYAAGVIDSEAYVGSVHYKLPHRRYPGYRLNLAVSQNHLQLLQTVQKCLGANGAIYEVPRKLVQNRQCYTLTYSSAHVLVALAQVYPYLIRKKELAMMLLKFFIDGRLWVHPGPNGTPAEIHKLRAKYHRKLKRML